ncbi:hypothetical protein ACJZ2D_015082 [Fusarium nematophilum]
MALHEKVKVVRLASVHYQHPDLDKAAQFLKDFGLFEVFREVGRVYFGGFGADPYLYVAENAPDSRRAFLGGTWVVDSAQDLEIAAAHPGASGIQDAVGPGGGRRVSITDPNGFPVTFIHGQNLVDKSGGGDTSRISGQDKPLVNLATEKPRQGQFRRFNHGPSPVHKLGHYGYIVPRDSFKRTLDWYTSLMNVVPTDAVFDPKSGDDTTCFMHIDLGKTFTDHHSFFLGTSPAVKKAFVHHSSFEVNDMDTQSLGHQWLVNKGYTNCWGIGRHVLGSQIFDYWFDTSGNILEHYSDGDLVNELTPFTRSPEAPDSLYIWGPNGFEIQSPAFPQVQARITTSRTTQQEQGRSHRAMKVVIIGAGIGGLVCAIACRRQNLDVVVVERTPALAPIGAGIQVPPNAARIARQLGLLPQLTERSVVVDSIQYLRYANGKPLSTIGGGSEVVKNFGDTWMVIARPDYHAVLWDAAKAEGADLCLGSEMESIDFDNSSVRLVGGELITGDVLVGADGLWSRSRTQLLGRDSPPAETGDLAYRATIPREKLLALNDAKVNELIDQKNVLCWMGPGKHCVFYPLAGGKAYNLVLIRPDDLGKDIRQAPGDLGEMKASFEGWDERLTQMISCVPSVLKWKLCHHDELEVWTKRSVALLGDACHPTLPYQAQGAAMAAEDGIVLGNLLGLLNRSELYTSQGNGLIPEVLKIYESLRKARTTLNVQGAKSNQYAFHLPDGPLQEARDASLLSSGKDALVSSFNFANMDYMRAMLGFDAVAESFQAFRQWEAKSSLGANGRL